MKKYLILGLCAAGLLAVAACERPADVASRNLSMAADNFEIPRRISFVNGITGDVLLVTEGLCSIGNDNTASQMSITCKTERGYIKNFLGLSDNVFFISEQLEGVDVSTFHYRTVFRPQSLIPDVDFQGDMGELLNPSNNDG